MQQEQILQVSVDSTIRDRRMYFVCKRCIDMLLVALMLIAAAPVMVLIALLIKLDSPGPFFFRQARVAYGGRLFTCYKFRTMYHNADSELHRQHVQALIRDQSLGGYKLARDPRITRVGHILRKTSIDELPQFFNVIKGDMSLVGPRPPLPYEVQVYEEWHIGRLMTVPGITGLWQVRGRSRVTFDEMVRMDLQYIAQQSLWLDLKILLLTIPAVLMGEGAD
jgi:lipopolysaccharide/colanic/teichoic acid biosynthesis glycosyltransferase